tara:strand:+ start:1985 stop:2782 length:798 start_codon:yes stop_codon:yes gene_type:complete
MESVLLIGCGAIGLEVTKKLRCDPNIRVDQILVRPGKEHTVSPEISDFVRVITSTDELDVAPSFVLECASHQAVEEYGPYFLKRGVDLGVISIGALSNIELFDRLNSSSCEGNSRVFIVPGAIGGVDALAAAGIENLDNVIYTSRKSPKSWIPSPAEDLFDLPNIKEATIIFKGTARDAANFYPKNANVAATIALAGLGFEKTQVTLIADPNTTVNTHHLLASGAFGELDVTIKGNPLKNNPKSSSLTAYSAIRMLRNRANNFCM